jgi:hypothetical protein
MSGLDAFTEQALGILTSSKLADAMDLSKEDPKIVERYGKGMSEFHADGASRMNEKLLNCSPFGRGRGRAVFPQL